MIPRHELSGAEREFIRPLPPASTHRPSSFTEEEDRQFETALGACPELAVARQLIRDVGGMVTRQSGILLPAWINKATAADPPGRPASPAELTTGAARTRRVVTVGLRRGDD